MGKKISEFFRDTGNLRWIVLVSLSLPMFASYFFDDIFSTISQEFENPGNVALGWYIADS